MGKKNKPQSLQQKDQQMNATSVTQQESQDQPKEDLPEQTEQPTTPPDESVEKIDDAAEDEQEQQGGDTGDIKEGQPVDADGKPLEVLTSVTGKFPGPVTIDLSQGTDVTLELTSKVNFDTTDKPQLFPHQFHEQAVENEVIIPKTWPGSSVDEVKLTTAEVEDKSVAVSADASDFDKFMAQVDAKGSPEQKNLVATLKNFVEKTQAGKLITPIDFINQQSILWGALKTIITHPHPDEFRKQMFIALAWFKEHSPKKGSLSGRYLFRFADNWSQDPTQLQAFQNVATVFQMLGDPTTRIAKLKEIAMDRAFSAEVFPEQYRSRVIQFFKQ